MTKKFVLLTLIVVLLLGCCACNAPSEAPTITPTESVTVTPTISPTPGATPKADLTLKDFTIIYPEDTEYVSPQIKASAVNLRTEILSVLSVTCGAYNDKIDPDNGFNEHTHEILIGNTNRVESKEAVDGLNLRYYDYVIKYVGTKLVINGGSIEATVNAVDYFINNMISENLATVEGCKKLTQTDEHYLYDSNIKRLYIDGEYIKNFSVVSGDDDVTNDMIEEMLVKTGEKLSKGDENNKQKFEIIIGECDREEYRQVIANMHDRDYAVEVINGKLVIAGNTDRGVELALNKFRSDYLDKKNDELDINSDTDFRYEHIYPVTSLKLCNRDISDFVIVTSSNNIGIANKMAKLIKEITGEKIKTVTDSADLYDAAIVLSKSGDKNAQDFLSSFDDDKIVIRSADSKIYIGTNNISYGDSPAINAFIRDVIGYDTVLGKAKNSVVDIKTIDYTTNIIDNLEHFIITQYHGIRQNFMINEDGTLNSYRIDENAAAGMNIIDLNFDTETNKKALEYCSEIGIRCNVYDWRVSNLIYASELPENWVEILQEVVNDYTGYRATYYYGICDEPGSEAFERIRLICSVLEELDPARRQYVNHFPTGEGWYDEFVQVVDVADMISYDRYVFKPEGDDLGAFYANLANVRNVGLKYGVDYMAIHLLMEHGNVETGPLYRYIGEAELSWQTYNSLAYGVSAVSYFTYWSPANDPASPWFNNYAMISEEGEKTVHYYEIQNIMKRFGPIADVIVDKLSLGVFHTKEYEGGHGEVTESFTGFGTITDIIAEDATIGMFEDDIMVIANGSYKEAMEVEIVTDSKLLLFDYLTGEWNELTENKLTVAVGSGELLKIVK